MDTNTDSLTPKRLVALYTAPHPVWDTHHLKGIDTVNWAELNHAYGSAYDVPPLLRALLSDNADHRDFACQLLSQTVCHQGTLYEATSHIVPFLIQLLGFPDSFPKEHILNLLTSIVCGGPGITAESTWARDSYAKEGLDFAAAVAKDAAYAHQAYAAVHRGLPQYVVLYADPKLMVRRYVTHLLCFLPPEAAQDVLPILETQLSVQTDPIVRAEIFADGAAFISRQPLRSNPLQASFVHHAVAVASNPQEDRRVRFAAALAALQLAPQHGDAQLIQIVLDGIAAPQSVIARTEEELSPTVFEPSNLFPNGFVLDHAEIAADMLVDNMTRTLAGLPNLQRESTLQQALERASVPAHAQTLGVMILGLAVLGGATYEAYQGRPELRGDTLFYATVHPKASDDIEERIYPIACSNTEFAALTPPQRATIAAVVRTDAIWGMRSNLFAAFGLPADRAALQALIG